MSVVEQMFLMITAIAGSTAIWKYFETRLKTRAEQKRMMIKEGDGAQYRADLQLRVEKLQKDLEEATQQIIELTKKVAELETENKFLKQDIEDLKGK